MGPPELDILCDQRAHGFVVIGAVRGDELDTTLSGVRGIKIGSRICAIDVAWRRKARTPRRGRSDGGPETADRLRFECAFL